MAEMLGNRRAQMHLALASEEESPEFRPEPFTPFYRRALAQSISKLLTKSCHLIRKTLKNMPSAALEEANLLLKPESATAGWKRDILEQKLTSIRIRVHGDFHLGQVMLAGRDLIIVDFEGEPSRSIFCNRLV